MTFAFYFKGVLQTRRQQSVILKRRIKQRRKKHIRRDNQKNRDDDRRSGGFADALGAAFEDETLVAADRGDDQRKETGFN